MRLAAVDQQHLAIELDRLALDLAPHRLEPVLLDRIAPQQAAQARRFIQVERPHRAFREQHQRLGLVAARDREQAVEPEAVGDRAVFILAVAPGRRQEVVVAGREIDGSVQHLADLPVRILGIAAKARAGRELGQVDFFTAQRLRFAVEQLAQAVQALDRIGAVGRIAAGGPVAAGQRHHGGPPGLVEHIAPTLVQAVAAAFLLALDAVDDHEGQRFFGRIGQRLFQARFAIFVKLIACAIADHRKPVPALVRLVPGAGQRRVGQQGGQQAGKQERTARCVHQAARRLSS